MKSTVDSRGGRDAQFDSVMDVDEALERLGGDQELLRDIIQIYLEDSPSILDKVRRAVTCSDGSALQRSAHSLKGLASTLSAHEVAAAASKLEYLGSSRNLAEGGKALEELDQRVDELNQAVQQLLRRK